MPLKAKKKHIEIGMVSIITPTYNSELYISATIQSVLNQTYQHWEHLIIDDASTDNTVEIIEDFSKKEDRIKLVKLDKNSGAGVARNKGIEIAKGDFIAFLDADDLWKPLKLEKQIGFMKTNQVAVCYSDYELINEDGKSLHSIVTAPPSISLKRILKANYIGNLTGVYSVKELGKIYMPSLRKRQDWALWLKAIKKAGKAYAVSEVLASYRVRKNSISSDKLNLLKYNYLFYRKACNFGPLKSALFLMRFLFEHFLIKSTYIKKTN